jgi:hypothetical protein
MGNNDFYIIKFAQLSNFSTGHDIISILSHYGLLFTFSDVCYD